MSDRIVFFGIGAQKAATTWLASELSRHPDVHVSDPKELHYWDTVRAPYTRRWRARAAIRVMTRKLGVRDKIRLRLSQAARDAMARDQAYFDLVHSDGTDHEVYLRYLDQGSQGRKVIGEITPDYALLRRETFAEMLALHESARFIFILRDPFDRLVSGLREMLRWELKHRANEADVVGRALASAIENPYDPGFRLSDYATTLVELEAVVPRDRILYLFYDNLSDPRTASSIGRFLEIENLTLNSARVVHQSRPKAWVPDEELAARARRALRPTYAALAEKFQDEFAPEWVRMEQCA